MDPQSLRDAFARHAGGVVVVSAPVEGGFRGLTASSFIAVSVEPPLVAVALESLSATRDAVVATRVFTVSVLSSEQEFVADRFAGRAPAVDAGWRQVPHTLGSNGLPRLAGAIAWFECALVRVVEAGDHDLLIAGVTAVERGGGEPLVLWERDFWRLGRQ